MDVRDVVPDGVRERRVQDPPHLAARPGVDRQLERQIDGRPPQRDPVDHLVLGAVVTCPRGGGHDLDVVPGLRLAAEQDIRPVQDSFPTPPL